MPFFLSHPFGYYGPNASRTLQFIGVGGMDSTEIVNVLQKVVDCEPFGLKVTRIDLCADWYDSTIQDCRNSIRVLRKRNTATYQNPNRSAPSFEAERSESGRFETLYIGSSKSRNYLRIYDKEEQLRKVMKVPSSVPLPTRWVRFERVYCKDGVPASLNTLGAFFQNGVDYDPFSDVEVHASYDVTPHMIYKSNVGSLNERQNAAYAHNIITTLGRVEAAREFRREGRKSNQMFALLDKVLGGISKPMPTNADLRKRYQTSLEHQLFGNLEIETGYHPSHLWPDL